MRVCSTYCVIWLWQLVLAKAKALWRCKPQINFKSSASVFVWERQHPNCKRIFCKRFCLRVKKIGFASPQRKRWCLTRLAVATCKLPPNVAMWAELFDKISRIKYHRLVMIQLSDHFTYKRLFRFAASPIMMMVFCSIYSVVDGLFVSRFAGQDAFTAVNLIYPFVMALSAVGFMFGSGGTAIVSKTMGEGKTQLAKKYFTLIVIVAAASGVVLGAVGLLLLRPFALWMDASPAVLELGMQYGITLLCALPFFMLQNMFQNFLSTAEKPMLGFVFTVASGVTNMVLDALFVAVFQWGILGAAIATAISQAIGSIAPIIYFACKNSSKLRFSKPAWYGKVVLAACTNGSSELLSNVSASLVAILYNKQLMAIVGETGVDAYGVICYVQFVFAAIFIGYCIAVTPIVGFNFGAQNKLELQNVFAKSLKIICGISVLMLVFSVSLARPIAQIFVGYNSELCEMTVDGMRLFSICYLFVGLNMFGSCFFTALNNGLISAILSVARTLVFQIVCIYALPTVMGLDGIWLATVVAEALSLVVTISFLVAYRNRYGYVKTRQKANC